MRTSVSVASSYPQATDPRQAVTHLLERVEVAEDAGFDGLYLGDHHATTTPYLQNVPMLARSLAVWGARPVGALFLLPLWPPVLMAEQVATLASMTRGRFVLQCAVGGGERQFAAMGVPLRRRARLFEDHLDVVRRLLVGEASAAPGGGGSNDATISPTAPEPVEVWIGAHTPPAIDRAARLGDAWYAAPRHPVAELEGLMAVYREACARHGTRPRCAPVRRDVHVAADDAEARRVRESVRRSGHRGFDPSSVIVGVHDEVVAAFDELASLGFDEVVCRQLAPDQPDALASLQRLGEVRRAATQLTPTPWPGGGA